MHYHSRGELVRPRSPGVASHLCVVPIRKRSLKWDTMENQLSNLRKFLPAEVSGAYLAIQGILNGSKSEYADNPWVIGAIVVVLAIANVGLYWKLYKVKNPILHGLVLLGFVIWIINIDTARFEDIAHVGQFLELGAPISLVLYSLITSFVDFPKRDT